MKKLYFLLFTFLMASVSFGQVVINEFQPNAVGTDPDPASFELKGTPSASFTGWLLSIEDDGANGLVDRAAAVSGTFDANGLLVVMVPDLENPSFTVILCDTFTGTQGTTDLDTNNDGTADDLSTIGTIFDAIGIPDDAVEAMYAAQLGGTDFAYSGDEPQLVFRDGVTGDLYAINDPDNGEVYDVNGTEVIALGSFDISPFTTTFGAINPVYTVSTGPVILVGTVGSDLDYEFGSGPSAEGTFTVEGTNLTDDILVTAPTDFEVSETSGGTFTSTVTLLEGGTGSIASTDIYVRLKESLDINNYSGDVTATSTGADPKTVALTGNVYGALTNSLVITGVYDAQDGSNPKGVELYVVNDIADLSIYGIGSANNGGGTDGEEYSFPADAVTTGTFIYVSTEAPVFTTFFGFAPSYTTGAMSINGDDAIELFESGQVIDVFGTIDCDPNATSSPCPEWEHTDGWAYRLNNTGPDGSTFVLANWAFSGVGNLNGIPNNAASTSPFPIGSYPGFLSVNKIDSNSFKVFPNPTNTGFVNITSVSSEVINAKVFDILGKEVIKGKVENNQLDVSNLNAGMYILKLSQNNASVNKKLVIQ